MNEFLNQLSTAPAARVLLERLATEYSSGLPHSAYLDVQGAVIERIGLDGDDVLDPLKQIYLDTVKQAYFDGFNTALEIIKEYA